MPGDFGQIYTRTRTYFRCTYINTQIYTQIHEYRWHNWLVMNIFCERKQSETSYRVWNTRSSIACLALRNVYRGAFSRPLFVFRFSASNGAIIPQLCTVTLFFLLFLASSALFYSRDVIATCIFYQTSLRLCTHPASYPSIHPSIHRIDPSIRRRLWSNLALSTTVSRLKPILQCALCFLFLIFYLLLFSPFLLVLSIIIFFATYFLFLSKFVFTFILGDIK